MRKRWRCFYCDEVFTNTRDAKEHFGELQGSMAACQIKGHEHMLIAKIRELEGQLHSYREDDNKLLLAMWAMEGELNEAVRRAEEKGFAKGVHEMRRLAEKQFGAEVVV